MAVIPILHWTGGMTYPILLVVAFALGAFAAPYFAAQKVIVPELLGEDSSRSPRRRRLPGRDSGDAARRSRAGRDPDRRRRRDLRAVDRRRDLPRRGRAGGRLRSASPAPGAGGRAHQPARGFRFIKQDRLLRVWWPTFAVGRHGVDGFFVAVPVLVLTRFGHHPGIVGLLIASFGVGALVGNAVSFRFLTRRFQGLAVIAACALGQAAPLWLLWLPLPAIALSALIFASGIANGLVNPSLHAITTLRVPPPLRPNVFATSMVGWAVVNPLGLFVTGPVLDAFGTTPVLIGFAAVQTVSMGVVSLAAARSSVASKRDSASWRRPRTGRLERNPPRYP